MSVDGNILTIKMDLTKYFGPSASGKTIIIASSEGNQSIPGKEAVKIGLNVHKKKWLAFEILMSSFKMGLNEADTRAKSLFLTQIAS